MVPARPQATHEAARASPGPGTSEHAPECEDGVGRFAPDQGQEGQVTARAAGGVVHTSLSAARRSCRRRLPPLRTHTI